MKKFAAFAALALLAACGGGGSGGGGGGVTPSTPHPKPTVTDTPTPYTAVNVTFATVPTAVAVQIAGGPWQAVTPGPSVAVDVPAPATTYGLAYVCPAASTNDATNQEFILQATTSDGTSFAAPCPTPTPVSTAASISGSFDVTAVPGATSFTAYDGYSQMNGSGGVLGTYSGSGPAGTRDIVALALSGRDVVGASILRSRNITNNAVVNIPPLVPGDAATTQTVTLPSLLSGFIPWMQVDFVTAGGTRAEVSDPMYMNSYGAIAAGEIIPGDYYDMNYQQKRVTISGLESINVEQTFTAGVPVSFALPRGPQFYTVGAAPDPTFTFDNAGLSLTGSTYDMGQLSWGINPAGYSVTAIISASWLGAGNTYTLPNLSAINGFFPIAPSNTPINWTQSSNIVTAPLFSVLGSGSLPIGVTKQWIEVDGHFTEP